MIDMQTYSRIITHIWPHLDEIVAIHLLQKHGAQKYPGIETAKIVFFSTGAQPEHKTWEEHRNEGTLLVGIGGGPFDEHPTAFAERKHGKSACQLVAEDLNLTTHPIYKRLIELVTEADLTRVHEFHIANRLKTSYRLNPDNPEKGIALINSIIEDWEKEQQLFVDARMELKKMVDFKQTQTISLPQFPGISLAVVQSDNFKMSAAARSLRISVLVQRTSKGYTFVFCDLDRYPFTMKYIMAKIRKAECIISGMSDEDIAKIPAEHFEREGKISEVTNWFYQVPGENILNGAESAPDIPPTKIPLELIVDMVKKNIQVK
jgi:hypothetical protein